MTEAELQTLVAGLFQRLPELVGFSVREAADDLLLSGVETFPAGLEAARLMDDIVLPLRDLLDEEPDARELLSGRTFARTLH